MVVRHDMKINLFNNFNITSQQKSSRLNFTGAPEKLAKKLLEVPEGHMRKLTISYDEAVSLYRSLGCEIFVKQGSHSIVRTPSGENIQLVMPHGKQKGICAGDVRDLLKYLKKQSQS